MREENTWSEKMALKFNRRWRQLAKDIKPKKEKIKMNKKQIEYIRKHNAKIDELKRLKESIDTEGREWC